MHKVVGNPRSTAWIEARPVGHYEQNVDATVDAARLEVSSIKTSFTRSLMTSFTREEVFFFSSKKVFP
jgi:hypothetical protein